MKKRTWMALGLALLVALGGCGASAKDAGAVEEACDAASMEAGMMSGNPMEASANGMGQNPANVPDTAHSAKLIYRGSMELETTSFDDAAAGLQALVERCGGHMQSSSLYYNGSGYRSAEYVIRVPAEQYQVFFTAAGELCHMTWKNEETEDVSMIYYDTAGRLKTQEAKLERLQELLRKAESMEDIITIESAISETEYAIESLSGELRNYDDLVDYSTVTLNLREVYKLSNMEEPADGFGDRLGTAFRSGVRSFTDTMENLVVGLAYGWVWVLLVSAGLVLVIFVVRRRQEGAPPKKHHFFRKDQGPKDPEA